MNYWTHLPNRDEVLEKVYLFLDAMAQGNVPEAEKLIYVGSMDKLRDALHYHLADYIILTEDDQLLRSMPDDLSTAISPTQELDEELMMPEFAGASFTMVADETFSILIGLNRHVSRVRMHFKLYELEGKYYLQPLRVSLDDPLKL